MGRESSGSSCNKIIAKYSKSDVKNKELTSFKIIILEKINNKPKIIIGKQVSSVIKYESTTPCLQY